MNKRTIALARYIIAGLLMFAVVQLHDTYWPQAQVAGETTQAVAETTRTLEALEVKGRAPKTGYTREQFGPGWTGPADCDTRDIILARDLTETAMTGDGCEILRGRLQDPYRQREIAFVRGPGTSDDVQIDHVVALSDAWQKGAQQLSPERRMAFSNDPLNLLAVDGDLNQQKGDSDAASWLPPSAAFRCEYVSRQIRVKEKYDLWVTKSEKAAMQRVLSRCR